MLSLHRQLFHTALRLGKLLHCGIDHAGVIVHSVNVCVPAHLLLECCKAACGLTRRWVEPLISRALRHGAGQYERCTVHFYRNVFSVTPRSKVKLVAKMLKAIHAQESKKAAREKARAVVEELCSMKLKEAAKKVEDSIEETLTYCDFPSEHWTRIRTNNVIERLNREIRRRTRVVGSFPDGNSALMLVCARLRHVAGSQWGNKKYMNMKHLEAAIEDASIAG